MTQALLDVFSADPAVPVLIESTDPGCVLRGRRPDRAGPRAGRGLRPALPVLRGDDHPPGPGHRGGRGPGRGRRRPARRGRGPADRRTAAPGSAGPGRPAADLAVGAWLLPGLIGRGAALELTLTGRWVDAAEALRWGWSTGSRTTRAGRREAWPGSCCRGGAGVGRQRQADRRRPAACWTVAGRAGGEPGGVGQRVTGWPAGGPADAGGLEPRRPLEPGGWRVHACAGWVTGPRAGPGRLVLGPGGALGRASHDPGAGGRVGAAGPGPGRVQRGRPAGHPRRAGRGRPAAAAWLAPRLARGDRVLLAAGTSLGFLRCYLGALPRGRGRGAGQPRLHRRRAGAPGQPTPGPGSPSPTRSRPGRLARAPLTVPVAGADRARRADGPVPPELAAAARRAPCPPRRHRRARLHLGHHGAAQGRAADPPAAGRLHPGRHGRLAVDRRATCWCRAAAVPPAWPERRARHADRRVHRAPAVQVRPGRPHRHGAGRGDRAVRRARHLPGAAGRRRPFAAGGPAAGAAAAVRPGGAGAGAPLCPACGWRCAARPRSARPWPPGCPRCSAGLPLVRYGTTESGLDVSNPRGCAPPGHRRAAAARGRLPGLVRGAGEAPPGADGEIQLRGPQVFTGYWHDAGPRRQAFTAGRLVPHRRLGAVDPASGHLVIRGRIKELIISGGMNVYPREVELALEQPPVGGRGRGGGTAPPALGRAGHRLGRAPPRAPRQRGRADRARQDAAGRLQVPQTGVPPGRRCPAPRWAS